jgi:hypothetical protein
MKRSVLFLVTCAAAFSLGGLPAFAQRGGGGMGGMGGMGGGMGGSRRQQQMQPKEDKVVSELRKNPMLARKVEDLLGVTDAQATGKGFKSVSDLMAAAHASKDLGIKFDSLKKQMVASKAAGPGVSLDKAILTVKSDATVASAKDQAKKAKEEGDKDIKDAKDEMKASKDAKS